MQSYTLAGHVLEMVSYSLCCHFWMTTLSHIVEMITHSVKCSQLLSHIEMSSIMLKHNTTTSGKFTFIQTLRILLKLKSCFAPISICCFRCKQHKMESFTSLCLNHSHFLQVVVVTQPQMKHTVPINCHKRKPKDWYLYI